MENATKIGSQGNATPLRKGYLEATVKKAYDTLKELTKLQQQKATIIEDKGGALLTILERWTEY